MRLSISIIIPCFNVETYVKQCLESVLTQCREGIEILAIDDASTDGTWDILNNYRDVPALRLIRLEKNIGLGGVRT